jgi:hypothetical protein
MTYLVMHMLKRTNTKGFQAQYILADTWFLYGKIVQLA